MSLAIVYTRAIIGISAPLVSIEAHLSNGLPAFTLVGLPETTVREARERVRSAIINSGFSFPARRMTLSLAPADMPKEGGRYDLPIALAILVASKQLPANALSEFEFIGELSLSGILKAVPGIIPALLAAKEACHRLVIPKGNHDEAALVAETSPLCGESLFEIGQFLKQGTALSSVTSRPALPLPHHATDFNEVVGQYQGKRALEIAAAGGHHLLLLGPPGTGKTMLATRLPTILPALSLSQALESTSLHSLAQASFTPLIDGQAPFRAPHHSASLYALTGGGSTPVPGEISLAHNGVLFLDELPEFGRKALDALRQPLEEGQIMISRAKNKVCYPARFQLIAAMNPSPTGDYQGAHVRSSPMQMLRYLNRLSGPLLDRFDLTLEIPRLPKGTLATPQLEQYECSAEIAKRVLKARSQQLTRQGKINALLSSHEVQQHCKLSDQDGIWLDKILQELGLSARAWQRTLKVARSIADLNQEIAITRDSLLEALSYRAMDKLLIYLKELCGY